MLDQEVIFLLSSKVGINEALSFLSNKDIKAKVELSEEGISAMRFKIMDITAVTSIGVKERELNLFLMANQRDFLKLTVKQLFIKLLSKLLYAE